MLDNLGSPAYIFAVLLLKICVQIVHFNFFISRAWSYSIQRKAAFLRLKSPGFLCDHRIDHGKLKRIIGATLGFKSMKTAYATIKGIEVMRALRKGQASAFYYGDPLGEMRLVSRVFEM